MRVTCSGAGRIVPITPRRKGRLEHSPRVQPMMIATQVVTVSDSFLSNAGWLFFAGWGLIIAVVSAVAFGRDLLRWRPHLDPVQQVHPPERLHPGQSNFR